MLHRGSCATQPEKREVADANSRFSAMMFFIHISPRVLVLLPFPASFSGVLFHMIGPRSILFSFWWINLWVGGWVGYMQVAIRCFTRMRRLLLLAMQRRDGAVCGRRITTTKLQGHGGMP